MYTKSIILASTLSSIASAAAIANAEPDTSTASAMPTLGGSNWYDWSATSVPVAAASTTAAASSSWAPVYSSQYSQWQPVATTTTPVYYSSATSTYVHVNPFSIYLTQTNEWGVVTGMPAVVTSQPAVVTSQPQVVTVQTSAPYQNSTFTTATSSSSSASFQQTRTASASIATHTGGATLNKVGNAALGLVIMGLGFSML